MLFSFSGVMRGTHSSHLCMCAQPPTHTLTNMYLFEDFRYPDKDFLFVSLGIFLNSPEAKTVAMLAWKALIHMLRLANKLKPDASDKRVAVRRKLVHHFTFYIALFCTKQHSSLWVFHFFSPIIILLLWEFSSSNMPQISPRRISDLCLHIIFLVWILSNRKAK